MQENDSLSRTVIDIMDTQPIHIYKSALWRIMPLGPPCEEIIHHRRENERRDDRCNAYFDKPFGSKQGL